MDLHLFDLNLLVALDALLTERNVTHAGLRLNISQPATSSALAKLRSFFQDELLVPVGRRMVLTPLAGELVQPVRQILLQTKETLGVKARFDPASSGRQISIAVSDWIIATLMPDVLRRAEREAPHITFDLRPVGPKATDELESCELDFLIAPDGYVPPPHPRETIFQDTLTCIIWSKNESVGTTLSLQEYLSLGHVVVKLGPAASLDDQFLQGMNLKKQVEVWVTHFSLAPELVIGTNRIATIPTRLATKYATTVPLRLLPLPLDMPPIVEMLHWHRVSELDPGHQWFRRLISATVAEWASKQPTASTTKRKKPRALGGSNRSRRSISLRDTSDSKRG